MGPAKKPRVTLGVSGSIAAYKTPDLVSRLNKSGFEVHVAITKNASQFVTQTALEVMSGHQVTSNQTPILENGKPSHIELGDKSDLLLIAPATASILGKLANGIVDNPVGEVFTALEPDTPVLIAPAMNGKMLEHWSVQQNIESLTAHGVQFISPQTGLLACGYEGNGKLAPNEVIVAAVKSALESHHES